MVGRTPQGGAAANDAVGRTPRRGAAANDAVGRFEQARDLFMRISTADRFEEFLTLAAYDLLNS
jgi:hypothetical protein